MRKPAAQLKKSPAKVEFCGAQPGREGDLK